MNAQDFRSLQEAYLEVVENQQLDEAEGSYGQTPQSTKRWNKATVSRMNKPASEYEKRGDKKKEVSKYSKHNQRTMALDADASRGPGKKSSRGSGGRLGYKMTQKDRDDARGQSEYGHTGYDPDFDGPPSSPGSKPKGKKLERQKKTGVSAESYDLYDIILSHLLDEGYAETPEAAEAIMVNMSEEWREDIMEGMTMKDFKANRRNNARREASADARKRGHEGKTWADGGRTYSPDEAKSRRAKMTDGTRQASYRVANDPDDDSPNDDHYPASKTKNPNKLRKQKAMGELG